MKKTKKERGGAECYDCGRAYGSPGFPDLIITNEAWRQISPYKNEGGLLCPSCICARLAKQKIRCFGAFMSDPIDSVSRATMHALRSAENNRETLERNGIHWKSLRQTD